MYEDYFGLKKKPFSIVPDPGYFYMSRGHREALAHLWYGITNEGGFVLLTGEVGAGKTTVCRRFLQLVPDDFEVAFILNPKQTAEELLATICDEFRIPYPEGSESVKTFVALINDYLLDLHEKGRKAILILEEAQNLKPEVLEQVRLLTNLETKQRKLLQMIMLGQPELRDMLKQPQLRPLSQRITARYHLGPLSKDEVWEYVEYRLSVAGLTRSRPFSPRTMGKLFRLTGGVPRLINVVCDRALLGAYVKGKEQIDRKMLAVAAREIAGEGGGRRVWLRAALASALLLVLCAGIGTAYVTRGAWSSWRAAFLARLQHGTVSVERTDAAAVATVPAKVDAREMTGASGIISNLSRPTAESSAKTQEQAFEVALPRVARGLRWKKRERSLRAGSGAGT